MIKRKRKGLEKEALLQGKDLLQPSMQHQIATPNPQPQNREQVQALAVEMAKLRKMAEQQDLAQEKMNKRLKGLNNDWKARNEEAQAARLRE